MLSTGMFISSTAFLPSSFSMTMNMYAMAAFLNEKWFYAIFCTAISALVGWPFAAVLGLPIVAEMLIIRPNLRMFWYYAAVSGILVCGSLLSVDSYYYGKQVLAPLNIVLYNVFSEHGPDLYGVEPVTYYLKNLLLNWNIAALLVPFAIPLSALNLHVLMDGLFIPHIGDTIHLFSSYSARYRQPHKEERFLFPVYPLIALFAAIALDSADRLVSRYFPSLSVLSWLVVLCFILASLSRTYALHRNFSSHIEVYKSLNEHFMDHQHQLDFSKRGDPLRVCVGKEWHRFPSSFFLPQMAVDMRSRKRGVHLHFLKSEFAGLLPKYYPQGRLPFITRRIPTEMNDMNKEEPSRYVPLDTCDYVVDLETPEHTTVNEPNYGAMSDVFRRLYSHPFLISSESHWFFRAFFIPRLSVKETTFANYTLYQRIPPTKSMGDHPEQNVEPTSSGDGVCSEDVHAEKTQEIVKDVMQKAAFLVRAATDLPRRGDDFELCNSFSAFTAFMEQQETRIRLLGIVMDELDRGGRDDVEVPKTIIGAESTKRKSTKLKQKQGFKSGYMLLIHWY
ncbi:plasmid Maintenance Protein, partial [Ostertagia ostertagi]